MSPIDHLARREFLRRAALACGGLAVRLPVAPRAAGAEEPAGYGPLSPVADGTTGLPLLRLPAGFSYASFGWAREPLDGGTPSPGLCDGMGVVRAAGDRVWLVRNHEVRGRGTPFAEPALSYDAAAGGGTTTLTFDVRTGRWLGARASLSGTCANCAGGPTPWQTWLTCEETVEDLDKPHGFVFEVPAEAAALPQPLTALGRFVHEAAAVDPATGTVYETEDRETAGFYRFVPAVRGELRRGGTLQMLRVRDQERADLRGAVPDRAEFLVDWVEIPEPQRAHSPGTADTLGVFSQGRERGGATFARLEGCWQSAGRVYFTATSGGAARMGQIWEYEPARDRLRLVYASPDAKTMDMPDNLTVTPRGGLVVCEDGGQPAQRLLGLTHASAPFVLAENAVVLDGTPYGLRGDFRRSEWAGATVQGRWLFANVQVPGITFAITGPWERGPL